MQFIIAISTPLGELMAQIIIFWDGNQGAKWLLNIIWTTGSQLLLRKGKLSFNMGYIAHTGGWMDVRAVIEN